MDDQTVRMQRLWEAIIVVVEGDSWEYESVPFEHILRRPRYQHLFAKLEEALKRLP